MALLDKVINQSRSPRKLAEAITAPSSLLLAGAGTAVTILAGAPIALAAGVGVLVWAGKTVVGIGRVRKPPPERIDPFRVGEPWRLYVQSAQQAQVRFQRSVAQTRSGPLRDRLSEIGRRVDQGTQEVWRVAQKGYALDNAVAELDLRGIRKELAQAERELAAAEPSRRESLSQTVQSIRARLESAERLEAVAQSTNDRLRQLDAQLNETVARAIELSISADSVDAFDPLGSDIDSVVTEMEALRQAIDETDGRPGTASSGGITATA